VVPRRLSPPYDLALMKLMWQPWSAASLVSGAVLLVLGSLMLPSGQVADVIESVDDMGARWVMTSFAFFLASVGLTLGLPTILTLLRDRGRWAGLIGIGVWAIGTIALAGYAAMLIFFSALVQATAITSGVVEQIADDPSLMAYLLLFVGAFYLGELLIAIALLRARTVAVWVPVLMLVHMAVTLASGVLPDELQSWPNLLLGVALMGIAVHANNSWASTTSLEALA
jgi:hypothetical protein